METPNNLGIRHIGIIMDGNGRWAKKRLMPRKVGHQEGARTFRKISDHCRDIGLEYLTVYAFSTENWRRPQSEVDAIMNLMREYIKEVLDDQEQYLKKEIRICFIGDRTRLDLDIQENMALIEKNTAHLTGLCLNIAVNYGSRLEILHAAKKLYEEVQAGRLNLNELTESDLENFLDTAGQPDPDLIIRTGGEYRMSNFLLWQSAYAEYMATTTLWPDFKPKEMDKMIATFTKRERRFGGVGEEKGEDQA